MAYNEHFTQGQPVTISAAINAVLFPHHSGRRGVVKGSGQDRGCYIVETEVNGLRRWAEIEDVHLTKDGK